VSTKKRIFFIVLFVLSSVAIGWICFLYGLHSRSDRAEGKSEQQDVNTVAKVKLGCVQPATMHKTITAYGNVIATPENSRISVVPFESQISGVMVTTGQMVSSGTVLMEVEPSHEATLQLEEARNAQRTAATDVEQVQKRLELKLGTNQELIQAQQALAAANARFENLQSRGIGHTQIKAATDGVVSRIDVQPGQIVPAGSPLIEIAGEDKLEIRLGVEPADAAQLRTGLTAEIHNVTIADSNIVNGQIRLISHRIDPSTRLVDVYIAMPGRCLLPLDTYVCGKIIETSRQTLAVPRSAVLTDGEHYSVFGIKDGKAVKYTVTTGLEDNTQVEIITDQLKPNDPVVIEGNYELEDGAAVQVEDGR